MLEEIRLHGRGGQGVVTAAELIARAAWREGWQVQAFPNFGVERTGAPVQAYARLSDREIITRQQIYRPTTLIIADPTLLATTEVFNGAGRKTKIIVNAESNRWPDLKWPSKKLYFSPATEIALEIFGKNIVSAIIVAAWAKYSRSVSLASLLQAIRGQFADKSAALVEKNLRAVKKAYVY